MTKDQIKQELDNAALALDELRRHLKSGNLTLDEAREIDNNLFHTIDGYLILRMDLKRKKK